uniref:Uncharacterized protein n=1 Tax=Arundo donax TaxID=35708 RepID=A0A0A9FQ66_ARUDO
MAGVGKAGCPFLNPSPGPPAIFVS